MAIKKAGFLVVLFILFYAGCQNAREPAPGLEWGSLSYRDTPGITQGELQSIEALKQRSLPLIYGTALGEEAFLLENGDLGGFIPLLCQWLSGFFEIPIVPALASKDELSYLLREGDLDLMSQDPAEGSGSALFFSMPMYASDNRGYYSLVSVAAIDPGLESLIAVLTRMIQNDGTRFLTDMYALGYRDYLAHVLYQRLSEEERHYLQSNPTVYMGSMYYNYPIDFYNEHENEWQGVFFDILDEVETLTGLSFEVINQPYTEWSDLYQMLVSNEISLLPQVGRIPEREEYIIWPDKSMMEDRYLLISKVDFPILRLSDILSTRVGLVQDYSSTATFNRWFPNHSYVSLYGNFEGTFAALERGDVDVMLGSMINHLSLTNYQERTGYKINYIFDHSYYIMPGFHKNEELLLGIMNEAFDLIDIEGITERWMRRTFDYQAKLLQAQRPWLLGAIGLSFAVFTLVLVFFIRSRNTGKYLESLIKKRTAELEVAVEASQAANQSKSAFLANMSHEMRTPMNVIVGLTDLMLEEENYAPSIKNNLTKVSIAGSTLLGLINDVLDISKIEAGKMELNPVKYDVPSLLNDIITLNIIRIEDKPIRFKLDIEDDLLYNLWGDDLRFKQVVNNILSNAFKYTQRGTVTLGMSIERDAQHPSDVWVSCYVQDTGIGIRNEDLVKLFTDYGQVDTRTNRSIEGTGLGLAIAKRLTEMMEGEITAESEYGKGSTFKVRIKQGYINDTVIGKTVTENLRRFHQIKDNRIVSKKLVRTDLNHIRVLVVDDMQTNLDVAAGLLGKYKMQIDCVLSGPEAIERIRLGSPIYDAIFVDHMMPGMDGVETVLAIRSLGTEYAEGVPIIALTANAVQGMEEYFINNSFQAFLSKPIDIMLLDSVIRKWVAVTD